MMKRIVALTLLVTLATVASSHTILLAQDAAIQVTPSMVVRGTAMAERGFYLTTSNGVRNYNPIGGTYYPFKKSNGTSNTYAGYKVTVTVTDPAQDNVMAYYPCIPR